MDLLPVVFPEELRMQRVIASDAAERTIAQLDLHASSSPW